MLTITPSNVLHLSCLRKTKELILSKRYPGLQETSPALRFGNVLHYVLRHVYDPVYGMPPHLKHLDAFIRAALLSQPYEDDGSRQHDAQRAETLVRLYVEQDDDAEATIAVERAGTVPIIVAGVPLYHVYARMDRIIVRPEDEKTLVCRDYKISNRALTPEQVFVALAVCKGIYKNFTVFRMEVDAITDVGIQRTVYASADTRGVVHLLNRQVKRVLSATEFPAEPGNCHYCQAKRGCPAFDVEAGLEAEELDEF